MKLLVSVALAVLFVQVSTFVDNEDKFIKKYAMMKVYESCFGKEVMRQIRTEMKQACAKCAAINVPPPVPTTTTPSTPTDEKPQPENVPGPNSVYPNQPTFDAEKLHQAILAFRPNPIPQPSFRPFPGNFYNPAFASPAFQAAPPMFYSGYQQVPFSPYSYPMLGHPYYGSRMSKEMDLRNQLDSFVLKRRGLQNITCVMQELGYLDNNLETNYAKIIEKIGNLPIGETLRENMKNGVAFCQKFSQCVPDMKTKSLQPPELLRLSLFFRCYKHKKIEACIMEDIREKLVAEDDEDDDEDSRRGKSAKMPKSEREKQVEDFEESMYELLYASDDGFDIDGLF